MKRYVSIVNSPIGVVTILADESSVNEITFQDKDIIDLQENQISSLASKEIAGYFAGNLQAFTFPTLQSGTVFQQEVWDQLLNIPYGETISYAKFAIQKPLAIRAMASANGKNKLAIVVPCHRVIGSDSKLVGYAGGIWRKKWLLQHESEISEKGQTELKF